ncbi:arylsulfatase J-like isoform X2 [Mercenaria mercenaria]|uniref:arylsulfatase J-like isoform X2 n=1 Tax=Mercenaria mercenaria TaxID=6596 RepID=UPI00234ED679|nr:arylsulfatase J-like isoform X2 [Mercenaria mercenaria]
MGILQKIQLFLFLTMFCLLAMLKIDSYIWKINKNVPNHRDRYLQAVVNTTRPHIILIVADDLGYNDVGYHGSEIKTPNVDKLALSGVRLENYYVQPVCTPTRGQLLTGRYQIHTGLQWVLWPGTPLGLALDNPTIADKMREAGYATHIVGKWHVGFYKKEYLPTYRGFDSFFGYVSGHTDYYTYKTHHEDMSGIDLMENDQPANISKYYGKYSTRLFTNKAEDIIRKHNPATPMFLYLPYQAVHGPLQAPKAYVDQYEHIHQTSRKIHAGIATCMDDAVGAIVNTLKLRGMWNNTVLIFTTDNGGKINKGSSNLPLRGGKGMLYEGGIRAVGFVHSMLLDEKVKGSISKELMHVTDWFPTLVKLAGGNLNGTNPLDGFDQWETIRYGMQSTRSEILHDILPKDGSKVDPVNDNILNATKRSSIRIGDWKLMTGDVSVQFQGEQMLSICTIYKMIQMKPMTYLGYYRRKYTICFKESSITGKAWFRVHYQI